MRRFFRRNIPALVVGGIGVIVLAVLIGQGQTGPAGRLFGAAGSADPMLVPAKGYVLELAGLGVVATLSRVEGGQLSTKLTQTSGTDRFATNTVSKPEFDEIRIETSGGTSALYNWFNDTVRASSNVKRSGVVHVVGKDGSVIERISFTDALITEISVPPADLAMTGTVPLKFAFKPQDVSLDIVGGGSPPAGPAGNPVEPFRFKLTIPGLESAMPYVSAVAPISVTQTLKEDTTATSKYRTFLPGTVFFGDVRLSVAERGAQPALDWARATLVAGQITRKTVTLQFVKSDGTTPVLTVNSLDAMIYDLEGLGPDNNGVRRLQARLVPTRTEIN